MLLWFGGVEAKPDKNRFSDGTLFSSEVCNTFLQLINWGWCDGDDDDDDGDSDKWDDEDAEISMIASTFQ